MKNKTLVKAFAAAKTRIENNLSYYICYALEDEVYFEHLSREAADEARTIISNRLEPFSILEDWVKAHVFSITHEYTKTEDWCKEMRLYRVRWLDSLIEEFN